MLHLTVMFIKFINKLLKRPRIQVWKKSKYRPIDGLDWDREINEILQVLECRPGIMATIGANQARTSMCIKPPLTKAQEVAVRLSPKSWGDFIPWP